MNCRWDIDVAVDCCSEQVEIVFSALHSTISEIGVKASAWQARNVTSHIIDIVRCNLYLTHHMILTWSDKCHLYKHYGSSLLFLQDRNLHFPQNRSRINSFRDPLNPNLHTNLRFHIHFF